MTALRPLRTLFLVFGWLLHLPLCVHAATPKIQKSCGPLVTNSYQKLTFDQAKVRIADYVDIVEELRDLLDKSQFDKTALVKQLDYDSERIVNFVKEKVSYQPYFGTLRGVKGTLVGRAGNALDQSLLLATLLKDAGFEARVVRASLTDAQARDLLSQVAPAQISEQPWTDEAAALKVMEKAAFHAGASKEDVRKLFEQLNQLKQQDYPFYNQAEQTYQNLLPQLEKAKALKESDSLPKDILESAKDYFWVQSRLSSSKPWADQHPAFVSNTSFKDLTPQKYYKDSIPKNLQHRLRFDVKVEQKVGSKFKEHKVMQTIEAPASNLIGSPLTYLNVPGAFATAQKDMDTEKGILESDSYFPALNQDMAPGGKAFDLLGNVAPFEDAASAMGGVFKTVGKKTAQAANALSALSFGKKKESKEKEAPLMMLTAQFYEVSLIAPGGKKKTVKRYVFDRLTPESRAAGKAFLNPEMDEKSVRESLAQQVSVMPAVGALNSAFIFDKLFNRFITSQPLYELLAAKLLEPDKKHSYSRSALKKVDSSWLGHFPMYYAFDHIQRKHQDTAIYRHEPTVVAISASFPGVKKPFQMTDVLFNSQKALSVKNSKVNLNRNLVAKAGIWESYAEKLGLDSMEGLGSAERLSTSTQLSFVSKSSELKDIQDSKLRSVTSQALSDGYMVAYSSDQKISDWWRINPESGEMLAMSREGRGEVTVSKVMLIISIAMAVMFAIVGYGACAASQNAAGDSSRMCCIADTVAYGGGAFIVGLIAGVFMEAVTAMMFFDIAGGYTMLGLGATGNLPSFC